MKSIYFLVLFISPAVLSAQTTDYSNSKKIYQISEDVKNAAEDIGTLYNAFCAFKIYLSDIKAGKRPEIEDVGSWIDIVDHTKEALKKLKNAKVATSFDKSVFFIDPKNFKCENKDQIINTLQTYVKSLDSALFIGRSDIRRIDDDILQARKTLTLLNNLVQLSLELSSVPLYKEFFDEFNWFKLKNGVNPVVGEYLSVLSNYRKKYNSEVQAGTLHNNNLKDNIKLITECDKPKPKQPTKPNKNIVKTKETFTAFYGNQKRILTFEKSNGTYTGGTYNLFYPDGTPGAPLPITNIYVIKKKFYITITWPSNYLEKYEGPLNGNTLTLTKVKPPPSPRYPTSTVIVFSRK